MPAEVLADLSGLSACVVRTRYRDSPLVGSRTTTRASAERASAARGDYGLTLVGALRHRTRSTRFSSQTG